MSSLAPPPTITTTAGGGKNTFSSSSGYSSSLFLRSFKVPINARNPKHRHAVSCKTLDDHDHHDQDSGKVDRRNILLGLGGLYGAATTLGSNSSAFADPILAPDVTKCVDAKSDDLTLKCCPPIPPKIIDFQLPPPVPSTKLRVRRAAHLAKHDPKYVADFNKAIRRMKALPQKDPRNFMQQANVHCAYCDGAYQQVGFPELELQVHSSWLFLPFHRAYLYFFEKICGEMINKPDFALPFWNWDAPDGMQIPELYTDKESSLYDKLRDGFHQPPCPVDLDFNGSDKITTISQQLSDNLTTMYKHMVSGAKTARLFMGDPYRPGCMEPNGPGSLERAPHNTLHNWTGDRTQTYGEDMGVFYSAARDPIFYAHHANVDRMWSVWKTLPGGKRRDFRDRDWRESSFVFYNEKSEMVRIKVRDCLDTKKLGYVYQNVEIPWRNSKPKLVQKTMVQANETMAPFAKDVFPASLNKVIKVLVPRPNTSRSKEEKDEEEEILVIEGIELKKQMFMKFDVFVNDEDEGKGGTNKTEFAGSFVHVPHKHDHGETTKTTLSLGISELLEDLDIEDHHNIMVTLVPKSGGDDISITGIKIDFD